MRFQTALPPDNGPMPFLEKPSHPDFLPLPEHTIAGLPHPFGNLVVLYGGECSSNRVCAGVCEGVSPVACNMTCRIEIRSIDD